MAAFLIGLSVILAALAVTIGTWYGAFKFFVKRGSYTSDALYLGFWAVIIVWVLIACAPTVARSFGY